MLIFLNDDTRAENWRYDYDSLDRLTQWRQVLSYSSWSAVDFEAYAFNAISNIISKIATNL